MKLLKESLISLIAGIAVIVLWPIEMILGRKIVSFPEFMENMGWHRVGKWTWEK